MDLHLHIAEVFDDQVNHHLEALFAVANRGPPLAPDTQMVGAGA